MHVFFLVQYLGHPSAERATDGDKELEASCPASRAEFRVQTLATLAGKWDELLASWLASRIPLSPLVFKKATQGYCSFVLAVFCDFFYARHEKKSSKDLPNRLGGGGGLPELPTSRMNPKE